VLALQGGFQPHLEALARLGATAIEVRTPEELSHCSGLILPGGESTTLMRQLDYTNLIEPLRSFRRPLFATCAGLIICSKSRIDQRYHGLGLLDLEIERNAYGTQVDSFATELTLPDGQSLRALFIRAPKIARVGPQVKVLAEHEGLPVIVQQGPHLGATCHPELTHDVGLHALFLQMTQATALFG
jgi:pyridoxal 5'-phosphate synthase pdxT subunit